MPPEPVSPCYTPILSPHGKRLPFWSEADQCMFLPLTRGKFAKIDITDAPLVSQHNWFAAPDRGTWYAVRGGKVGPRIRLHHEITGGRVEGMMVDHINRDGLDNRRDNLRVCTPAENTRNRRTPTTNTSGYIGVSWMKRNRKWRARVEVDGARIHIGMFNSALDAAIARDAAAIKFHGEFASLNFPETHTVKI